MNWLSQMIHTEIDLTRMYPADQPRSRTPKVKTKVVDHAAVKRSNKVRARYLKALGNDRITAEQLRVRLGELDMETNDIRAVRTMLARLLADGLVIKDAPSRHRSILWSAAKEQGK